MEISVKAPGVNRELTVTYDFGANLAEMQEKFGSEIVFLNARRNMVITLQALVRNRLDKKQPAEKITAAVAAWKPSHERERLSKVERAAKVVDKMSAEEKAELLKLLQS